MYYLARLYSGSSDRSMEELDKLTVSELLPKLKEGGGLMRYTTVALDDGRLASGSVYKDKDAAQKGLQIAKEFAANTNAFQHLTLNVTFEGEIGRRIEGDVTNQQPAYGAIRLMQTSATASELGDAIVEQYKVNASENNNVTGRIGTYVVQLGAGKVATFIAYVSEAAMKAHSEHIEKTRKNPATTISKMLQSDPVVITGRILSANAIDNA